jgi:hypothetical protein
MDAPPLSELDENRVGRGYLACPCLCQELVIQDGAPEVEGRDRRLVLKELTTQNVPVAGESTWDPGALTGLGGVV